jgi:ribosomal protein S18 acetylase RimI-like enzyme
LYKMKIDARPYRDPADFTPMRQLLIAGAQAPIVASYMHPGFLDWATHLPPDEAANRRNLRLWERADGGEPRLAAWAMFFQHEGSFDFFIHPALHGAPQHEAVMDDYVDWATARARAAGLSHLWPFWAMADDQALDRLMRARGFVIEHPDPAPPLFGRALDDLPDIPLPAGFKVQAVRTDDDGQERARVAHAAFRVAAAPDDHAAEYAQFRASAVYEGERDLLVRAPDGRGASACTIWLDPVNAVGLFEPVATHPAFQRQGLGQAVMAEGLRRMRAAGMRQAVLGFDPHNRPARALYASLGFGAVRYFAVARKPL